jgi:ADP-ribose pyrophosphatase YjhB (NUDIX family)
LTPKLETERDVIMIHQNVGVGIIIEKDDQVLLLRRRNVLGDGTWSTPGGHLDSIC